MLGSRQVKTHAGGNEDKQQQTKHKPGARRPDEYIRSKMRCQSSGAEFAGLGFFCRLPSVYLSSCVLLLVLARFADDHRPYTPTITSFQHMAIVAIVAIVGVRAVVAVVAVIAVVAIMAVRAVVTLTAIKAV